MMMQVTLKYSVLSFLLLLTAQVAHAANGAQSNLNIGTDMPGSTAKHTADYTLVRFQLEQVETLLSPRFSFTLDLGTGISGGEINAGIAVYPVYKARAELPVQPFLGVDGGAFLGSRDKVVGLYPGITVVGGADVHIFKKFGFALESDYLIYSGQTSVRIWGGLTYSTL